MRGTIPLRYLLSFTSGLDREYQCIWNPCISLKDCIDKIRDTPLVVMPDAVYFYGSTHLHVAARMAEVVSGQSWNALFAQYLHTPLGRSPETTYYTAPRNRIGSINPVAAGGLVVSAHEYAKLLAVDFHKGVFQGATYARGALFDEQAIESFPTATIGHSPFVKMGLPFRYGLGAWLECDTPSLGCDVISSLGAFGFTPWFDRATGYYAVLAMEQDTTTDNGVVAFSVDLAKQLKPLIAAALSKQTQPNLNGLGCFI